MGSSEGKIVFQFSKNIKLFLWINILLVSCFSSDSPKTPFYDSADFTAEWIPLSSKKLKEIHKIQPFIFQDQSGSFISDTLLRGNIYAVNFFFTTCPSICPKMTNNLIEVQDKIKNLKKVKLVSFSVMPWVDSVEVLNNYAKKNKIINSKWHLLTGDKNKIYDLARTSFFAEKRIGLQKKSDEFLHTENIVLVDYAGRIRGVYNATLPLELNMMINDIYELKKEK